MFDVVAVREWPDYSAEASRMRNLTAMSVGDADSYWKGRRGEQEDLSIECGCKLCHYRVMVHGLMYT